MSDAPYGLAYGYRDKNGFIRCTTVSLSDARRNARLNNGTVVRGPMTSDGTVHGGTQWEDVDDGE